MSTKTKLELFQQGLAKTVYDVYPGSDLLPIDAPTSQTTMEYLNEQAKSCGDTLFEFIVAELCEDGDTPAGELVQRLNSAIAQLAAVAQACHVKRMRALST